MSINLDCPATGSVQKLTSRRIIVVLLSIIPLSQIGLDVYTPALPRMAHEFAASNDLLQNTVTAYILGLSLAFIPMGLLADAYGRKRVLLGGLGLLVVASVGCAVAQDLTVLLGLRFLQGMGASAGLLLAAAIAADCFRGAKLVSVLGLCGAAWGSAPVLAPAIGGLIVQWGSWRLVFWLFAATAALVAVLVVKLLPETLDAQSRAPIDVRATLRVVGGALRHRKFVGYVVMFGLVGAAQMSFGVVGPFLYQVDMHFSPATYGVIALVVGIANLTGELACGGLAQRLSTRRLAASAWAVFALGGVLLTVSAYLIGVNPWVITAAAALALLGIGVLDPQSKGLAMGVFDRNIGLIAGVVNTACYLIVSVATALMAYLPEESQAPLGWLYVAVAGVLAALLVGTLTAARAGRREAISA